MTLLESGEMYLETIHVLSQKLPVVRSLDIAEYMDVSKPSVSRAVGLLKDDGYITVEKSGFIFLTEKGKAVAEKVYERHQLLTEALKRLGVSEDIAEQDACKIEHYLSEETFIAIKTHVENILNNK